MAGKAIIVEGQAVRSPFTTFGIGEPYGNSLIQNQGMGGIGVSNPQYLFMNNQNPALLVFNTITVFQAGAVGERRTIKADTLSETNVGGNLSYLVTAFPVIPDRRVRTGGANTMWSTGLGLMPYSSVNFNMNYTDYSFDSEGEVIDTIQVKESGSGGLTQFYWSNGIKLYRDLALGVKIAYIFGPIQNDYSNYSIDNGQISQYTVQIKEKTTIKDFNFTIGAAYSDTVGTRKRYGYNLGVTYALPSKLNASRRAEILRFFTGQTQPIETDTIFTKGGFLKMPASITAGASIFRTNKWTIGTEFNYQDWSAFESINNDDEGLGKSWRVALGGEITPDVFAVENYLKRMTYRAGLSYERYPFIVNGNQVNDFGINFGFSMPAGRSSLDLAFKVGKRGDQAQNILAENYFKVYFGITFNDQWFIKRKFD